MALQPLRCRACACAALALLGWLVPGCISSDRASDSLLPPGEGDSPVTASANAGAGASALLPGGTTRASSGSSLFIAPGDMHELRSLGQDCSAIAEEPRCLGVSEHAVVMFGMESGRYCTRPVSETLPIHGRWGMPTSLVWREHEVVLCADRGDSAEGDRPSLTMLRISLDDGMVRHLDVDCAAVVSWGDEQLFFTSGGTALPFEDFDQLVADRLALGRGAFLPLVASASDDDELYSLVDAGNEHTIWRITLAGDAAAALANREVMSFADAQPLRSEYTAVSGLDVTTDHRLAMVREGGGAGIEVYDLRTQARVRRFGAPFEGDTLFPVRGLVCEPLRLP